MNDNQKEIVQALLGARAYVFSLLHKLLMAEPTKELLAAAASEESLAVISLFEEGGSEAAAALKAVIASLADADDAKLDAIRLEYTKLFLGPDKLAAPPWESCYTAKERALFQESTLAVREWYHQYSYVPAGYPSHPDDHVSLMMQFIALTTDRARECFEAELMCGCRSLLEGQRLFEKNHMLNWLPRYAGDMSKADTNHLYPRLVREMAKFVEDDHQMVGEMLALLNA